MRYGRKLRTQAAYGGRARQENLFGHKAGVRCLGLLPGRNLLVTGVLRRLPSAPVSAQTCLAGQRDCWAAAVEALLLISVHP